ncbi:SwmB domain-containing protein [Paenibacillus aquistagni]|uniref:SwmB domain-containing protein n=1 Tax=Paenibacillus aquistagni TaxID=1852522 RepID=UPI000B513A40|nr:SwmB domain-containing protein [Paenibacillus aquistagni]
MVKKTFITLLVSLFMIEGSIVAGAAADPTVQAGSERVAAPGSLDASFQDTQQNSYRAPKIISFEPGHQSTLTKVDQPVLRFTFDEEVDKGSGDLIVYEASSHKEVWRSSVKDRNVTLSDDDRTVNWKLGTRLAWESSYYVTIGYGTFKGERGDFVGQYGPDAWLFKTPVDASAPYAVSYSPAAGQRDITVGSSLSITFNEPVWAHEGYITIKSITRDTVLEKLPVTSSRVTGEGTKTIKINPSKDFQLNEQIAIIVDKGAFRDKDKHLFRGIAEGDNWRFTTKALSADTTPPVIQSYRMINSETIKLTYNEALNTNAVPPKSAYRVLVNGEERTISRVSVKDNAVEVKLSSGVAAGQVIVLAYAPSSQESGVEDRAGNRASDIGAVLIENGQDTTAPKMTNAVLSGSTLKLTFSEALEQVSSNAASQFKVTSDNRAVSVRRIEQSSSNAITLTLQSSVSNGQVAKLSYTPGSYPLKDKAGNPLSAIKEQLVQNMQDTKAPTLETTSVKGNLLTLTYNELLDPDDVPMKSHYSVLVNDIARYVDRVQVLNHTVVLTLSAGVKDGDKVKVSYVPGEPRIRDLAGNAAGGFSYKNVTDASDHTAPTLKSGIVKGSVVTLVFSEKLDVSSMPASNQFYVYDSNVLRSVNRISMQQATVTLVLDKPVSAAANVSLTYVPGNTPLQDANGNKVAAFGNAALSNQTDQASGRPEYVVQAPYDAFLDANLYLLQSEAASTSSERSRYGESIKKYTVSESKLRDALQYAVRFSQDHHLAFEVPVSEKAAMVAVPLQVLEEIHAKEKDAKFSVRYGHILYTLPIDKLNISQIKRQFGYSSSIYIQLQIEEAAKQAGTMLGAIEDSGALLKVLPIDFYLSAYAAQSATHALQVPMEARVKTMGTVSSQRTTMIRYDRSQQRLQYIPNTMKHNGGLTVLHFYPMDNEVFAAVERSKSFSDIRAHWAQASIAHLANKFIIEGVSSSRFAPNASVTRGQFAVLLARSFGLEANASGANAFSDVGSSHPMAAYIGAAAKAGIIGGYENGTFRPNQNITREQMAVMLVRAMDVVKRDTSYNSSVLQGFKDRGRISSYAKEAVIRSVSSGLIAGVTANTFDPQGDATRAQAAVMLERLLVQVNYLTK